MFDTNQVTSMYFSLFVKDDLVPYNLDCNLFKAIGPRIEKIINFVF